MARTTDEIRAEMRAAHARADALTAQLTEMQDRNGWTRTEQWSAGDQERWNRIVAGSDRINGEIRDMEDELRTVVQEERTREARRDAIRSLTSDPAYSEPGDGAAPRAAGRRTTTAASAAIDPARCLIDSAHSAGDLPDYAAERTTGLLFQGTPQDRSAVARWVTTAGSEEYRSAFAKILGDPVRGHLLWTPQEADAYRAVAEVRTAMGLTDANGGYMVPLTLDPAIMLTNDGSINPLRQLARVVQTYTDSWQGVTSAGATAEWKAEHAQAADGSPTVDDAPIPVHLGDVDVIYSYEVGMDAVDFLGQLRPVIMDAAENLMATAYTTGSGSGQPKGIVTGLAGTSSEINSGGSEALVAADAFTLQNALPARFSGNASWQMHIATMNTFRQFETTNGALKFPEMADGRLLGKPLHENSNLDGSINAAATASNYVAIYGDVKAGFVIVDRIGATLEILPGYGANNRPTAQRHAFLTFRTGSDVVLPQALRLLDVPTAA